MRRMAIWACALLVAACIKPAGQTKEAQALVDELHRAIAAQQAERILPRYAKSFLADMPRELWVKKLNGLVARYGRLRKAERTFFQKNARPSADDYIFGYRLVFEHGVVRETVTVERLTGEKELKIAGHVLREPRASSR